MLATFGLSRIELSLAQDAVSADDVAELLEQAKVESERRGLAVSTEQVPTPPNALPLRAHPLFDGLAASDFGSTLPTRVYVHHGVNPQFQPTRQADRV